MSIHVISLVLKRRIAPASFKLVAIKLADCASDDGSRVFPALSTVAAEACVSIDTARRAIKKLMRLGVLKLIRKGGRGPGSTNEYAFDMEVLCSLPDARGEPDAGRDDWVDAPDEFTEAGNDHAGAVLGNKNQGSNLQPFDAGKGGIPNAKGGTGATQTVKNQFPLIPPTGGKKSEN